MADPPPASTHNDTLSQLVLELQDRGASEITIAERSYQPFNSVIAQKGIDMLAEELNFNILNIERSWIYPGRWRHFSSGTNQTGGGIGAWH